MEIDDEVYRFRYVDPSSGQLPNTRASVLSAISQFQTDDDFANLRPLIEGVYKTGVKLSTGQYARILRTLGTRGRVYDVVELARGVKRTGWKLDRSEKVNELLHFVQLKAVDSGWEKGATARALRTAEMVLELLEEKLHHLKKSTQIPSTRDPLVLMAPLHLAAAMVVKRGDASEETIDKVVRCARKVASAWPAGTSLVAVHPPEAYEDEEQMGYLTEPGKFVTITTPLLHGLQMAAQAIAEKDAALARELSSRAESLDADIQAARKRTPAEGGSFRSEEVYKRLYPDTA
jgi:urease gamma subunit